MFPEEYMPGVDVVIPDVEYLMENREKVKNIILTHGHEDHIGAMPFMLRDFNIPVFGTSFTIELVKEKLREHNLLQSAMLHKVKPGEKLTLGPFEVEFIRVNHSILEGVGLALRTPEGLSSIPGTSRLIKRRWTGRARTFPDLRAVGRKGFSLFSRIPPTWKGRVSRSVKNR
jgi:ribonuclease J